MHRGQFAEGKEELRVALSRLVEQTCGLQQVLLCSIGGKIGLIECFSSQIKIVGGDVFRGPLFDRRFLLWRKLCLKLIGDPLGDVSLAGKDVSQLSVVSLCQKMHPSTSIYQLRSNPPSIAHTAYSPLQDVRHTESFTDIAQIADRSR